MWDFPFPPDLLPECKLFVSFDNDVSFPIRDRFTLVGPSSTENSGRLIRPFEISALVPGSYLIICGYLVDIYPLVLCMSSVDSILMHCIPVFEPCSSLINV